ncbi:MAG TPA: TonB-dependent receptor [Vicinamibacterales bacterium]|nr:TonB-dependent receptor [Vicinamibacterales bacterium]
MVRFTRTACALAFALLVTVNLSAQSSFLAGKVTRDNGDPMGGAALVVEELKREVRTADDGTYRVDNVPPGTYHVAVRADGYSTRRTEVVVTPQGATLDLVVDLDLHFAEVVSVSPNARPQFESYQPTSVLAGQELQKQLESTIGATLQSEPGVAMRSLGPGPARPVIRGLDGDRVAVLQDGQRVGDLSSQSGDHGVTLNPSSAQRIEVIRGPATLLYGANAIGGLVNVITDQIPTTKIEQTTGDFIFDTASNAREAGGAADVHFGNGTFAVHLGGGGRRNGNYSTPEGEVENSQSRSSVFNVGASWTGDKKYAGLSYGFDESRYGVPIVEDGLISLTPTRHAFTFRAGGEGLTGLVNSYRATAGVRRYEHDELEGDEVGTHFDNDTEDAELLLSHKTFGRMSGTVGGSLTNRAFNAVGAEALAPAIDQRGAALFLYEELVWPHVTFQFGGRFDHTSFDPSGGVLPARDFQELTGSVGLLFRPAAANDNFVVAVNLARAARNPALEELYFFGAHPGNFAFEIGNPALGSERALGLDVSVRARGDRVRGEVTVFHNKIDDFIFRNPISEVQFEEREEEFDRRFGVVDEPGGGHGHDDEFPFVEFVGADSRLFGIEAHADVDVTANLVAEVTYDWVRGNLSASNEPLPRIPPFRVIPGLRYQRNALQVGGTATFTAAQKRVFGQETPTDGYALLKLYASYSFPTGRATNTITARLDNATDRVYRNHLNYLKDVLPEMGRNFKVVYSVSF